MRSPGLPGLEAGEAVRSPDFWKLAVVFLCIPIVVNGTVVHLVPLLTDRGIPANQAVAVFSGIGASLISGRLLCGFLLDRFFGPHVAIAFVILAATGVIALLGSANVSPTTIGAVLVGLGMGAEVDLIAYLQSRYFGLRAFGQIYGYLFAVFTRRYRTRAFHDGNCLRCYGFLPPRTHSVRGCTDLRRIAAAASVAQLSVSRPDSCKRRSIRRSAPYEPGLIHLPLTSMKLVTYQHDAQLSRARPRQSLTPTYPTKS